MSDCNKCHHGSEPKAKTGYCPPKVIEIKNAQEPVLFHRVDIPAAMGDDTTYPPKVGLYKNVLVVYEANNHSYLYNSDGVPTEVTADLDLLKKQVQELEEDLTTETTERKDADQEIWTEIETIEAASDVVDVVGTYAELQAYDTSKLHDKDLIKVLKDETHDDAITYYRWSTSTSSFSYVGAEGPYYTASETDTLLAAKQDTLIAGANIQIAADGKTISATDTTYTHFTGATASTDGVQGLVPGPLAGDEDKFLKGDGTWETISSAANTIFYMNASESGGTRHIYKNPDMTGAATSQEVFDANDQGQVILRISTSVTPDMYSDCYLQNAYKATGDYQLLFLDEKTYRSFDTTTLSADTFTYSARVLQDQLTAGTNIQINGNTISATDTTYSNFTGATSSTAGVNGLVPAPAMGDEGKYLAGDGTWKDVGSGAKHFYIGSESVGSPVNFYNDRAKTDQTTYQEFQDAVLSGPVQLYKEYDADTYWITDVDLVDIFVDSSIAFYSEADQERHVYAWDSTDSAPVLESERPYYDQLQADWNVTNASSKAYIKNKPTIPTTNNISSNDWSGLWQ